MLCLTCKENDREQVKHEKAKGQSLFSLFSLPSFSFYPFSSFLSFLFFPLCIFHHLLFLLTPFLCFILSFHFFNYALFLCLLSSCQHSLLLKLHLLSHFSIPLFSLLSLPFPLFIFTLPIHILYPFNFSL